MEDHPHRTGGTLFSDVFLERAFPLADRSVSSADSIRDAFERLRSYWNQPVERVDDSVFQTAEWIGRVYRELTERTPTAIRGGEIITGDGSSESQPSVRWFVTETLEPNHTTEQLAARLVTAVHDDAPDWIIVTDGRRWRLYQSSDPVSFRRYHGIDLRRVLQTGDRERFGEFYLLFSPTPGYETDQPLRTALVSSANEWRRTQRSAITTNVREAVETIATALYRQAAPGDGRTDEDALFRSAVVLCFRLLVILLGEHRPGPPFDLRDPSYRSQSLTVLADTVRTSENTSVKPRLRQLFETIDTGVYPGWLFARGHDRWHQGDDPEPIERLGADTLTAVVSLLTVRDTDDSTGPVRIDYSVFSPRQLGMLYESLLGCTLTTTTTAEPTVVLGDDDETRKETGSYYTPDHVVEFIIETTLTALLDGDPRVPSASPTDSHPLELAILDPAMGCGHFLLGVADWLLNATVCRTARDDAGLRRHRQQLVDRCLFGVDRDPIAVELATAALWLWSVPHADSEPIDPALETGNSLLGIADLKDVDEEERLTAETTRQIERYRSIANVKTAAITEETIPADATDRLRAAISDDEQWAAFESTDWFQHAQQQASEQQFFHWPLEFGGPIEFDAVVTNPPYLRSRALDDAHKRIYRETYTTADGLYDSYGLFIERACELGQRCAMIVPNKWTTTKYGHSLRRLLLRDCSLEQVVDVSSLDVFPEAGIYPVILSYTTNGPTTTVSIRRLQTAPSRAETVTLDRSTIESLPHSVIPVNLSASFLPVLERTATIESTLGEHLTLHEGIHTGNARSKLVVDEPVCDSCERLVDGGAIDRYHADWNGQWIRYDDGLLESDSDYATLRDRSAFDRDRKFLIRDISYEPVAAIDTEQLFPLNTLYSGVKTPDSQCSLEYLLGVFNSSFIAVYFRQLFGGTHVGGEYLRFKPMFTRQLPIPVADDGPPDSTHHEQLTALLDGVLPATSSGAIERLVGRLQTVVERVHDLSTDPADLLATTETEPLSGLPGYRVHPAAEGTRLTSTARAVTGLRIGSVSCVESDGSLVVQCSARYKPTNEKHDCDQWGYTETPQLPAVELRDCQQATRRLVREIVSYAVEHADGTAGFRRCATKTLSPVDRLGAITLPTEAGATRAAYLDRLETRDELERERDQLDALIDALVYDQFGLTPDERDVVETLCDHSSD